MPDRLSVQNLTTNTPPKIGRSLTGQSHPSPLSQRLPIGPRCSSLTSSPNSSQNANLSGVNRLQRGSSLKYELNEEPAGGAEDPMEVVHRILKAVAKPGNSSSLDEGTPNVPERPTELASNIDFGGLSLEEFAGVSQANGVNESSDTNANVRATGFASSVKDCKYPRYLTSKAHASCKALPWVNICQVSV